MGTLTWDPGLWPRKQTEPGGLCGHGRGTVREGRGTFQMFSQQALVWKGFTAQSGEHKGWKQAEICPGTWGDLREGPLWL